MNEHIIKRTEITIETHSVTTIRTRVRSQLLYCKTLGEEVVPVSGSGRVRRRLVPERVNSRLEDGRLEYED